MISELCIDVINSFQVLQGHLNAVREHICVLDRDLPAWYQPPVSLHSLANSSQRDQAASLIGQLEYLDGQQPREILVGAGIIAASAETIEVLNQLNLAKNKFKQAMLNLKAAKIGLTHELLAQNLSRMGMARVHLKQCYRKIPYYLQRPNKIAWTWANTRSIKKITIQEAEQLLLKHTRDAGIERQLRLLQGLDAGEKLAIVQELAPHLRANLVMPTSTGTKRVMVKGPVPIFYLQQDNQLLPELTPPGIKRGKDKERVIRKDVKINPEPFLPAIRAHRYLLQGTDA